MLCEGVLPVFNLGWDEICLWFAQCIHQGVSLSFRVGSTQILPSVSQLISDWLWWDCYFFGFKAHMVCVMAIHGRNVQIMQHTHMHKQWLDVLKPKSNSIKAIKFYWYFTLRIQFHVAGFRTCSIYGKGNQNKKLFIVLKFYFFI